MLRPLVFALTLSASAVAGAQPVPAPAPVPPAEPPVPEGRRLSPRNDAVMVAFTSAYSGDITTRDLRLRGGAPVLRGDGYGVALLLGYSGTYLDVAMPDSGVRGEPLHLHRFDATLGGGGGLAPGWSLRASAGVTHASDLDVPWHTLQVTSSVMIHRVLSSSEAVLVGLVYTSSADFFPVLPIVGYVYQPPGGRFRFDAFLPRHVRAEYELHARLRGALGVEVAGTTWAVQRAGAQRSARRVGGTAFAELQLVATRLVRLEVRAGLTVDRYALPEAMTDADGPLQAAGFAQLALLIAP